MTSFDSVKGDRPASRNKDLGSTGVNLFKSESIKEKEIKTSQISNSSKAIEGMAKTSTGGRVIVKRGLSKGRKWYADYYILKSITSTMESKVNAEAPEEKVQPPQ